MRCLVRPWRTRDAASLVRHANDLEVARQLRDRFPHPYTAGDARAFLTHIGPATRAAGNFAIEVDGEAVGGVGYTAGDDIERYSAEIGYWLGQEYWRRGIVTEAVLLLTGHLFTEGNMLRLFAVPFADNAGSARVLEKAGYVREAILHASCVKYGTPRDQCLYARINHAWRGIA